MFRVNRWAKNPAAESDLPIIIPSSSLTGPALRNNEYGKAALGYLTLKQLLGDELFKKGFHAFIQRWNGKHPTPWDMFYSFNDATGKNLNWFWDNWYFSNHYIDLNLDKIEFKDKPTAYIKNIGGFAVPFVIQVHYADRTSEEFSFTPSVWEHDQKEIVLSLPTTHAKSIVAVKINTGIYLDADESNNVWKKTLK